MKPHRLLLAILAACSRAEGGPSVQGAAVDAPATGVAYAFRLPHGGGTTRVYTVPDFEPAPWAAGRVTAPRSAVGVDGSGRRLLFRDARGALQALDLVSARERSIAPAGTRVALGSDGVLLAVDSAGAVLESRPWGTRPWTGSLGQGVIAVFAAPGARLLAVRADTLAIASRESGVTSAEAVPSTDRPAADREGDAVAFPADSGITVVEVGDQTHWFVPVAGRPGIVAFSPSGHQVYVAAAERSELVVIDRFQQRQVATIALDAPASDIRVDPWGRVLLVRGRGEGVGTVWVVSLARRRVTGSLTTSWASDLPTVSQEGFLIARAGDAVVARDARTLDSLGALANGADDLWFVGRGAAPAATAGLRAAVADSTRRTRRAEATRQAPPAASRPTTPTPAAASQAYWVQVSVSRNENWARALAADLTAEGHRAQVESPVREGEGFRVLNGPYRSREAADSAGRSLGRPYWVVERAARTP